MSRLNPIVLAAACALLAACSFDGSALDARPSCLSDNDCPQGVCVSGSCFDGTLADASAPDADDAGLDAVDDAGVDAAPDAADTAPDVGPDALDATPDAADTTPDADTSACNEGDRICADDDVLRCNDAGEFERETTCEDGPCVSGACAVFECEPGETSCVGEALIRCNESGVPVIESQCDDSEAYCATSPEPQCKPRTCTPGTATCGRDNNIERCDERGIAYSHETYCGADAMCADGVCEELECTPADVRCVGPFVYATCDEDGQSSTVTECPDDTFCTATPTGAECVPQECAPGTRRCSADATTVSICDERGSGYTGVVNCDPGQICDDGFCANQICEPDTIGCSGDFSYIDCNALGTGGVESFCDDGFYCDDEADDLCVPQACTPGASQCAAGTLVEICDAQGTGFTENELCEEGDGCLDGECVPVACPPATIECVGYGEALFCNNNGTDYVDGFSCEDDEFCNTATDTCDPHICTPGTNRCDDRDVLACDDFGATEELLSACDFGCEDGSCQPNRCGDGVVGGDEQCDDGNDDPCDGCNACQFATATAIDDVSVTAGGTWTPGAGDFTAEAWINVTSTSGALFGIGERTSDGHLWVGVVGGLIHAELRLSSDVIVRLAGRPIADTGWHHIAVIRFAEHGLGIFVDGELDALIHDRLPASTIGAASLIWVGSEGTTTAADAQVDQLRISNTRRYGVRFNPPLVLNNDANTVALYDMNGQDPDGLADRSTNERHLVATGITRVPDACYDAAANARACGDGNTASWEECDDGNNTDRDGCTACTTDVCRDDEIRGPTDQCYLFLGSDRWTDQEDECEDRSNSGLVTINNALENDWLVYMLELNREYWIGLNDRTVSWGEGEGDYRWDRGSSGFRNWASGEPNNGNCITCNEDCTVLLTSDQWNDADCSSRKRAICERDP